MHYCPLCENGYEISFKSFPIHHIYILKVCLENFFNRLNTLVTSHETHMTLLRTIIVRVKNSITFPVSQTHWCHSRLSNDASLGGIYANQWRYAASSWNQFVMVRYHGFKFQTDRSTAKFKKRLRGITIPRCGHEHYCLE